MYYFINFFHIDIRARDSFKLVALFPQKKTHKSQTIVCLVIIASLHAPTLQCTCRPGPKLGSGATGGWGRMSQTKIR